MAIYVYGQPGGLIVKVGYSGRSLTCVEREQALKRFWRGGKMLYVSDGSEIAERRAHKFLKSRFWLEGEWFVCGVAVARAAVRRAVRLHDEVIWRARKDSQTPQLVKQILKERLRRPDRSITQRDMARIDQAWADWEVATGKKRPKVRGPRA